MAEHILNRPAPPPKPQETAMDATKTNRDMLYRAFGLLTAEDADLIASALMSRAAQLSKADGTAFSTPVIQQQRDRARDVAAVARAVAEDLRSGRA